MFATKCWFWRKILDNNNRFSQATLVRDLGVIHCVSKTAISGNDGIVAFRFVSTSSSLRSSSLRFSVFLTSTSVIFTSVLMRASIWCLGQLCWWSNSGFLIRSGISSNHHGAASAHIKITQALICWPWSDQIPHQLDCVRMFPQWSSSAADCVVWRRPSGRGPAPRRVCGARVSPILPIGRGRPALHNWTLLWDHCDQSFDRTGAASDMGQTLSR